MRVFIASDIHGEFEVLHDFIVEASDWDIEDSIMGEDTIIILGDAYLNYWLDRRDWHLKRYILEAFLDWNLFIIRGNHDARPEYLPGIEKHTFLGANVLVEPEYPNIKYAIDGNIYKFKNTNILTIGGAHSIDKASRLSRYMPWFADEQPSLEERDLIWKTYIENDIDVILSHTCPNIWVDKFREELSLITTDDTDMSTEKWLDDFLAVDNFKAWYFGHFHDDMKIGEKGRMLFNQIVPLTV